MLLLIANEDSHTIERGKNESAQSEPVPKAVVMADLLEHCDPDSQTEVLNCLDLGGIAVPQLPDICHNEMAKVHFMAGLSDESDPALVQALKDVGPLFRNFEGFYLLGTGGSITFHHHDGGGCWTEVEVLGGSKLWSTWDGRGGPAHHIPLVQGSRM